MDKSIPNGVTYKPLPTDYVSGDGNLAGIDTRILVSDWTPYVPKGERQSGNGFESNNCTGFSYTNVIETQFNYFKQKNLISIEAMLWLNENGYLDENGELNCSDRALGSMAGTTSQGNSLNKVAETARKMGLLPESLWPSVFTTYEEYYKPVPQNLLDLGVKFLEFFSLPYSQAFSNDVSAAPLYVALCTCKGWNTDDPVIWCNAGNATNHANCLLKSNPYKTFDSYPPFVKDLGPKYNIPYFYKALLNMKGVRMMIFFQVKNTITVWSLLDGEWIGFSDINAFNNYVDGRPNVIIQLDQSEFNKVKSNPDVFKS